MLEDYQAGLFARTANTHGEITDAGLDEDEMQESREPEAREYVLNSNPDRMRFHYPNCRSVDTIKAENRVDVVSTREDLIAEGYVPCGNCKP